MPTELAARFRRLAADERAALISGRFGALAELVGRKRAAVEELAATSGGEIEDLRGLAAQANANQRLIEAALKGVRSARTRVRIIQAAANGMTAYAADGTARRLTANAPNVEKRS